MAAIVVGQAAVEKAVQRCHVGFLRVERDNGAVREAGAFAKGRRSFI